MKINNLDYERKVNKRQKKQKQRNELLTTAGDRSRSFNHWYSIMSYSTWTVVPYLPSFPKGLENSALVSQFLTILKGKFMDDFQGNFINRFFMWRPLSKFMSWSFLTKIYCSIPPVYLFSEGRDKKFLECNQS